MAEVGEDAAGAGVGQPLHLPSLARTADGDAERVPGTPLAVQALTRRLETTVERALWLLVLEGELIVDLPYGDFRVLKTGDALQLDAGLAVAFEPVEDVVVCRLEAPTE